MSTPSEIAVMSEADAIAIAADQPMTDENNEPSKNAAPADEEVEEEQPDLDEMDENNGKVGKDGKKIYPTLPTYHPIWSSIDLPGYRRTHCDAGTVARRTAHLIREGDSVIAYESRVSMTPLVLKRGEVFGNRFGSFHHTDMIGTCYGAKISARGKTKGWIVLLPFAPDLWTNSLTHRTQILYQADIAYIIFQLDLKPGDVVFESGTGSGSLTTALATTIRPHGHVHTFEFNADRVKKAKIDFANNKLDDVITVRERDVVGNGFPMIEGGVNAVFLDLPAPWNVIESSHHALKHQGRLCSFSPCIEQVQRVCLKLDELGFSEIVTIEILLRTFDVQTTNFPIAKPTPPFQRQPWHNRPLTTNSTAATTSAATATATTTKPDDSRKRALEDTSADGATEKKLKNEDGSAVPATAAAATESTSTIPATTTPTTTTPTPLAPLPRPTQTPPISLVTTRPYQLMRGHTGYLTFAVCNKY